MTPADLEQLAEKARTEDWHVVKHFNDNGNCDGIAIQKGTEWHCQLAEGFKLRRAEMREFLRPMFNKHGYLTTRVPVNDTANQRFNRVFGFTKTWSDGVFNYYILTALPFEGSGRCQS